MKQKTTIIDFKCKTCRHWKNHQSELNYSEHTGFCVNEKFKFNTTIGRLIGVIDRQNTKSVSGNPSHDIEVVKEHSFELAKSRYALQTEEEFGCIYHSAKK